MAPRSTADDSAAGRKVESRGRNSSLDGLRAFSILGVLMVHAGFPWMEAGWLGVDVFFVISGFLICTLLLQEQGRSGTINLPHFWMRRVLRLLPAYIVYATILTIIFCLSWPGAMHVVDGRHPGEVLIGIWTYTSNYVPMGGLWDYQWLTRHLWSLAVEEQFYIVFPVVILAAGLLTFRWSAILLTLVMLALLAGAYLSRALPGDPQFVIYGRGISIIIGCLVAAVLYEYRPAIPGKTAATVHRTSTIAVIALFIVISVLVVKFGRTEDQILPVLGVPFWFAVAVMVGGYWYRWSAFGENVLTWRPVVFAGKISYGIYLFHMLAWGIVWDGGALIGQNDGGPAAVRIAVYGARFLLFVGLSFGFAVASWNLVETPFSAIKARRFAAGSHRQAQVGEQSPAA